MAIENLFSFVYFKRFNRRNTLTGYRAFDNKYISEEEFKVLKNECLILSDKLGAFINYLKQSEIKGTKFKK